MSKGTGTIVYACEKWYDTPREVNSTFFRDSIRHDDNGDSDLCTIFVRGD